MGSDDRPQGRDIRPLPERLAGSLRNIGAEIVRTSGRFIAENAVAAGNEVLEAKHIVVATGSKPRQLPFPGAELMITSDEVLTEREQPGSVVFVGGGVIAFEFAHVYVRAGSKVTILQDGPRFLGKFDQDAVAEILAASRRIGIDARADVSVKKIESVRGRRRVTYVEGGRERAITVDRVIYGAGRVADLDGLDLPAGKVAAEKGRSSPTRISARHPTTSFSPVATRSPANRNSRRSPPTRDTLSAATSSAPAKCRTMTASPPACSRSPAWRWSAARKRKRRQRA